MANLACRVCGFLNEDPPWGQNGNTPSFEICPCCGVEFGYEDSTLESVRRYREKWLTRGDEWNYKKARPANWSVEKQMDNIPPEYK